MRCHQTRKLMQEHLDGTLTPAQRERLEQHLAACAACRVELALVERLDLELAGLPIEEAPQRLTASVMSEIEARESRRAALERAAVLVGVPVGLVSAGIAIWLIVSPEGRLGSAASKAASRVLGPALERISTFAGSFAGEAAWAQGATVQGMVWALAAAALSLMAITALRLSRERSLGWN